MIDEYIDDGKPHILSKEFGYILNKLDYNNNFFKVEKIRSNLIKEWIKYKIKTDDENIINILLMHFSFSESSYDEFSISYRPPWIVGVLKQMGMIFLKFKRYENDGLE
jgi:hypothetical protein